MHSTFFHPLSWTSVCAANELKLPVSIWFSDQVQWNLGSRTTVITNKVSGKKVSGWRTVSRVTNTEAGDKLGISAGERQVLCTFRSLHIPARISRAFSWISLCFVVFLNMLLNKTPMGKIVSLYEHFGLRTASRNELNSWTEVPLY
jgi:hypothetical protein